MHYDDEQSKAVKRLNHTVLTRFNNLPFSLRATNKLQTFKTNFLKHIFQTI